MKKVSALEKFHMILEYFLYFVVYTRKRIYSRSFIYIYIIYIYIIHIYTQTYIVLMWFTIMLFHIYAFSLMAWQLTLLNSLYINKIHTVLYIYVFVLHINVYEKLWQYNSRWGHAHITNILQYIFSLNCP